MGCVVVFSWMFASRVKPEICPSRSSVAKFISCYSSFFLRERTLCALTYMYMDVLARVFADALLPDWQSNLGVFRDVDVSSDR